MSSIRKKAIRFATVFCVFLGGWWLATVTGYADSKTTIKAVLFYKNDCQSCATVIQSVLPDYMEQYGSKLKILAINNSEPKGGTIFLETVFSLNLSPSFQLPTLIIGSKVLHGLDDIRENLPKILSAPIETEAYDWPVVKMIRSTVGEMENEKLPIHAHWIGETSAFEISGLIAKFKNNFEKDRAGNTLAVIVLLAMIAAVGFGFVLFFKGNEQTTRNHKIPFLYPVLVVISMFIAGHLYYSGITDTALTCGPVGKCNSVQQSEYAYLFGIVPVSLLGLISYVFSLIFWVQSRRAQQSLRAYFVVFCWGMSCGSVAFFIYLTFLEPFIIGASCSWCLSAASLTTLQALIATRPAKAAVSSLLLRSSR